MVQQCVGRLLVIRGGAIGDFILTLPLFEALRTRFPRHEVEVLGYPAIAELAVGRRYAARSRAVDRVEWSPLFSRATPLADAERDYLRAFERVFLVWPDDDGAIRAALAAAGVADVLHVNPMPPSGAAEHVGDYMARQCERGRLPLVHREPHLFPDPRDQWWAERYMRVTGAGINPILGIHLGSGSRRKNWPPDRFAAVARYWVEQRAGNVLLTVGPADGDALAAFRSAYWKDDAVFILENEPLPHVAAVLERCDLFVGNDSGITHIAAAVRIPTLALFGPTDPNVWAPRAPRVVVLRAEGDGGLDGISPQTVVERLEALRRA